MKRKYVLSSLVLLCVINLIQGQSTLKVMTFNKLFTTSSRTVLDVIRSSDADIIGIQESYGAARSVANSLGFYYHTNSQSEAIISRYPIISTNTYGVKVKLPEGLEVFVFNAHLTSYPYGPYDIRDGQITSELQAINSANRARSAQMIKIVNEIQKMVPSGTPVFFTGDFNEPSHLDWTQRAADEGIHMKKVNWPTSQRATSIGLKDSWRIVYPNETLEPGNTWTPNRSVNEVYDRIDIIYHRGENVIAKKAVRYGPTGDEAEILLNNFASDHRAMMVFYEIPKPDNGGNISYGENLIKQSSAEQSNLDAWIQVSGTSKRVQGGQSGYPDAKDKDYFFWLGNSGTGEIYQNIDVEKYRATIDAGKQSFLFNGFTRSYRGRDRSRIKVAYISDSEVVLDTYDSDWRNTSSNWEQINDERIAPVGTRKIKVSLFSQRNSGTSNDGYFDDLTLKTGINNDVRVSNSIDKTGPIDTAARFSNESLSFNVWPNPTVDNINFSRNKNIRGEVTIIDMVNRIKKRVNVSAERNTKISIRDFPKGGYIFQFTDEYGTIYREFIFIK